MIYRLIVWTFTWNLRFHFSLLLHWKNRSEKYTVYYFPVFFFVPVRHFEWPSFGYQKFGSLIFGSWLFFLVGFLDPHFVTVWMLYVTGYELFENDCLHWKSLQVFWLDFDWLNDLGLAAQFVQEGTVGEEAIFILNSSQFIEKLGTVILGDFISY